MNTTPNLPPETIVRTPTDLNSNVSLGPNRPLGNVPALPSSSSHLPSLSGPSPAGSRIRNKLAFLTGAILLLAGGIGLTVMLSGGANSSRPDLLLHTVKRETITLNIVERGTLESAENREVSCRVKASKGGNYSTVIKWVIDDGSQVEEGQRIMVLDSAALRAQRIDQNIAVLNANAAFIKAGTAVEVVNEENKIQLLSAENLLRGAELDVEKYVGLPRGSLARMTPEARAQAIREMEVDLVGFLERNRDNYPNLDGEFQQLLDDVNGRIELAEAEHEQWKDKTAYSQRMVIKGYVTQSQAQADESRLNSASETLKKLRTEKRLLQTFVAQKTIRDYCSAYKEAEVSFLSAVSQTKAREREALAELRAREETLDQEKRKLIEIDEQIDECTILAPQKGLVVYYQPEQSRYGGGSQQSIIAQGEPVREGQKMLRIPNLDKMQVVARVHEATIARIRSEQAAHIAESIFATSLLACNILPPVFLLQDEEILPYMKHLYAGEEARRGVQGQRARIRVDAFADRPVIGHVRNVATVASQDYLTSDVKVYPTTIIIDDRLPGLRPGMSAEVTIEVEDPLQNVLTVPLQAILGGPEGGDKRKVYVMTPDGPQEREIRIGLTNDEKAEVREGLEEGEKVVTNLRALLGDKVKIREPVEPKGGPGRGRGRPAPDAAKNDASKK